MVINDIVHLFERSSLMDKRCSATFITMLISSASSFFSLLRTSPYSLGDSVSALKNSFGVMLRYSHMFKNCPMDGIVLPDDIDCM